MKREGYWLVAIVVLVALAIWGNIVNKPHYGLDIKGGVRAVLQARPNPGQHYDLDTVVQILSIRLNSSGVASPTVQTKPPDQIIVEIPNVTNQDQVVSMLQTTAQLEFRWYRDAQYAPSESNPRPLSARYEIFDNNDAQGREEYSFLDRQTNVTFMDQAHILQAFQQQVLVDALKRPGAVPYTIPAPLGQFAPSDQILFLTPDQQKNAQSLNQQLQEWQTFDSDAISPPIMTGNDIQNNAHAGIDPTRSIPVVDLTCTSRGAELWSNFTRQHNEQSDPEGDNLTGIILDGRVLSAPAVDEPILDGNTQISGGFRDVSDAQSLANLLNAGALPVPLAIVQTTSVDPLIGGDALHKMIIAGCVAGALVLLFMAGYYLLPGLVADIALIFYTLFALAIFKGALSWFIPPVVLTLPGIAAFILSVGMAVDANILIFERLKEELRNGKALRPAIDAGFKRAFTAIRDSNICTLITCTILWSMGTPDVKGFALTLGIGVVVSLFTAITVTRTLLYLLVDAGAGKNLALFGLSRQWVYSGARDESGQARAPMNVIKNRIWFYALSLIVIIPGLLFWGMGGLKRSIEFTGGTQVEVTFAHPVSQQTVQHALSAAGYKDNLVQMANGGELAYVSIKNSAQDAYKLIAAQSWPSDTQTLMPGQPTPALNSMAVPYQMVSHALVGGVISKQLTVDAFEAVLFAAGVIVLYLAMVFAVGGFVAGLRFGTSAIVALLHDVLVLIGSFAILGYFLNWQIDSMFIVATLTVVGFSVHNTIVIFDRLRENLRHRLRGDSFEEIANRSILQSFARSINTSFTVILTLTAMMLFGEPSTRLLIAALLIGVVSGTYSAIFNATPILVDWENWIARRRVLAGGPAIAVAAHEPVARAAGASSRATGASTRASGGSAKPIRPASEDSDAAPVAQSQEEADGAEASSGAHAISRSRPKKRSARRY